MPLKQQVDQRIQQSQTNAGYSISVVPFHTHDGINSPYIAPQRQQLFTGYVNPGLNPAGAPPTKLPKGWTMSNPSSGSFSIVHNLGSINYIVVATCFYYDGTISTYGGGFSPNNFDVYTAGSIGNIPFSFILVLQK